MKTEQAVRALAALAQSSRLAVFRSLVACGDEGMAAGKMAETLGIPPATMSFHLKELLNAGLIDRQRSGRSLIYRLNVDAMRELLAYLLEDCCRGRPELCQPIEQCGATPSANRCGAKNASGGPPI